MRKSRFTEPQIMAVLRQAESGVAVPELCREHGISTASFYKWRSKYSGFIGHCCKSQPARPAWSARPIIYLSSQISGEPRRFNAAFYDFQFVVRQRAGSGLVIPASQTHGFAVRILLVGDSATTPDDPRKLRGSGLNRSPGRVATRIRSASLLPRRFFLLPDPPDSHYREIQGLWCRARAALNRPDGKGPARPPRPR